MPRPPRRSYGPGVLPYHRRHCDECGAEYTALRRTSRYCGGTCRQRANRAGRNTAPATNDGAAQATAFRSPLLLPRSKRLPPDYPDGPRGQAIYESLHADPDEPPAPPPKEPKRGRPPKQKKKRRGNSPLARYRREWLGQP